MLVCAGLVVTGDCAAANRSAKFADSAAENPRRKRRRFVEAVIATAAVAGLFGTCLSTATIPVLTRKSAASRGRDAMLTGGRFQLAEQFFESATVNDPLSPSAVGELAELKHARWKAFPRDPSQLQRAIALQKIAITLDPHNYRGYWTLGRWLGEKHGIAGRERELEDALTAYKQAVDRYPTNSRLLAEYAEMLHRASQSDDAAKFAATALQLDATNHREGHSDKYLSLPVLRSLESLRNATDGNQKSRDSGPSHMNGN